MSQRRRHNGAHRPKLFINFGFLNPQSLKTRVTLVTLLVLLLSFGALGTYAGRVMREDLGRHLGEQQFATVSLLAAQVNQELTDRLGALEMVASGRLERRGNPERAGIPSAAAAAHANHLILLAEDNEINRDVMKEQLRLLGYRCELAEDGAIALQMWQTNPGRYALLLTDCHMPHLDGFELTAAIRAAEPAGTHLPIIAATANAIQGEDQRCRERGMDDYLSKPLRMNELAPMLQKWLPEPASGATPSSPIVPINQ